MNLHELLIHPGTRLPFSRELSTQRLSFPAVLSYPEVPVGEGYIENSAGVLTLRGSLRGTMRCRCPRPSGAAPRQFCRYL